MSRTLRTLPWILAFTLGLLTGCLEKEEQDDHSEYRKALPSAQLLEIDVPAGQGNGALAVGEPSTFYEFTRLVSLAINGRVAVGLTWLSLIALMPPTDSGENYRVWGPTEPKGLEKFSWKMRVDKLSDTRFAFTLDARPKGSTADGDFLSIIAGEVTPGDGETGGVGTLTLHYDNSKTLGVEPCNDGIVEVDWDASTSTRKVDVRWIDFVNTCDQTELPDANYHYEQAEDASGVFEFAVNDDIHELEAKPLIETMTMRSRWQADGLGRSDVIVTGGEIPTDLSAAGIDATEIRATQCWTELFAVSFLDTDPDEFEPLLFPQDGEHGDAAACGHFTEAEYPSL
ncbi:MAG: hypothetical protein RBU37_08315 [Myxococcota bacterium]|jgi:hypothetical protein|nr:hypothetical protein [Myxococcota bacterium]